MAWRKSQNVDEYLTRLRSERDELDALYRDLLIGVTRFFRDPDAFALLEQRILPELLTREPRNAPLRLWVAGCATGEEAYSLAILLQELMAIYGERPIKIFATDVHRGSLEQATLGVYGEEAIANVSPDRLARYFMQNGNTYQVVPELRQMIVFAQHNVISDAPFTRVDLDQLPKPADLSAAARAATRVVVLPFRAQPGRRAVPRPVRDRSVRSRTDSRSSTNTGSCIERAPRFGRPSTRGTDRPSPSTRALAVPSVRGAGRAFPRPAAVGLRRAARRDDAAQSAA